MIDNIDSFTYNLVHLCHQVLQRMRPGPGGTVEVYRPGQIDVETIRQKSPKTLMISPGPGAPEDAHLSLQVIEAFSGKIPILGVCLGMQAIAVSAGASVIRGMPVHGKKDLVFHHGPHPMFEGIPSPFEVVRYHSLQVDPQCTRHAGIHPLAWTGDGVMMALESLHHPLVWGVQFHPESIGSAYGARLIGNFLVRAFSGYAVPAEKLGFPAPSRSYKKRSMVSPTGFFCSSGM